MSLQIGLGLTHANVVTNEVKARIARQHSVRVPILDNLSLFFCAEIIPIFSIEIAFAIQIGIALSLDLALDGAEPNASNAKPAVVSLPDMRHFMNKRSFEMWCVFSRVKDAIPMLIS
jgi:hypothetical protein